MNKFYLFIFVFITYIQILSLNNSNYTQNYKKNQDFLNKLGNHFLEIDIKENDRSYFELYILVLNII